MLREIFTFEELTASEEELWNDFHARCPQAHFLQSPWYNRSRHLSSHAKIHYFRACDEMQKMAASAIMLIFNYPLIGYAHAAIYRGPTLNQLEDLSAFLDALRQEASKRGISALRLAPYFAGPDSKGAEAQLNALGFVPAPENSGYVTTAVLDLQRPEDELFSALDSKLRWRIRRAQKNNPLIRSLQTREECETASELTRKLARKKQIPALSTEYLDFLVRSFQEDPRRGMTLSLNLDDRMLSFVVLLASGKRICYEHGASDPEVQSEGRSHLLLWEALRAAKSQGFCQFDLGGIETGDADDKPVGGVSSFKKGFSGSLNVTTRDFILILNPAAHRRYLALRQVKNALGGIRRHLWAA